MLKSHDRFYSESGKRLVLVVDDEFVNREMLKMILESDYSVITSDNGQEALETIQELENMEEWEKDEIIAIMELCNYSDVNDAINDIDNYIIYSSIDEYYDSMDELVDLSGLPENLQYYFDYDSYHRDCMMDAYVCNNGLVLVG